jgi:hypothetical protein
MGLLVETHLMFSKRQVLVLDSAKPSVAVSCKSGFLRLLRLIAAMIDIDLDMWRRTRRVKHSFDGTADAGGRALDDERVPVWGDEGDVWTLIGHVWSDW